MRTLQVKCVGLAFPAPLHHRAHGYTMKQWQSRERGPGVLVPISCWWWFPLFLLALITEKKVN